MPGRSHNELDRDEIVDLLEVHSDLLGEFESAYKHILLLMFYIITKWAMIVNSIFKKDPNVRIPFETIYNSIVYRVHSSCF